MPAGIKGSVVSDRVGITKAPGDECLCVHVREWGSAIVTGPSASIPHCLNISRGPAGACLECRWQRLQELFEMGGVGVTPFFVLREDELFFSDLQVKGGACNLLGSHHKRGGKKKGKVAYYWDDVLPTDGAK
ncbi:hypothetical protein ACLOJK_027082 [Asimina triloba]